MAYTTDLVYAIYGKDKTAGKTLKGVGKEADNAGEQFKRMGKVAATSFLAVGAAAGALAVSSIKNAIEDEKSQRRLAIALKNTVGATKAQTASVEDYITKTQARYGVVDDKLRPSLQRLVTATKDVTEAQNLQTLALDVSAGTGKDLETVSNAIAKAHGGNLASLQRLGLGLDASVIKSKDTKKAFELLSATFSGQAAGAADSLEGRFGRLKIAMDETKESIGYALMPIVEKLATYLTDTVVPNVQSFVDGLTGVKDGSDGAYASIHDLGEKTRGFFKFLGDNKDFLGNMAAVIGAIFIGAKAYQAVAAMTGALTLLRAAFVRTTAVAAVTAGAEAAATGGLSLVAALPAIAAIAASFGVLGLLAAYSGPQTGSDIVGQGNLKSAVKAGTEMQKNYGGSGNLGNPGRSGGAGFASPDTFVYYGAQYTWDSKRKTWLNPAGVAVAAPPGAPTKHASGGAVSRGTQIMVGESGPELFTPTSGGNITPNNRLGGLGGMNVVINVSGSVVHERDLAVTVRDNIAQLMRRRGLNPSILGV